MATPCPNCGKSIRPGAKFCGFCGYILGKPGTAPPPSVASPPERRSTDNPCPHCGKQNRPGVKFCANCGNLLTPVQVSPLPGVTPEGPPVRVSRRRRSRFVTIGFLVTASVIVCGSLLGIAWALGLLDKILPTRTPSVPEVAVVDSGVSTPTETQAQVQLPTETIVSTVEIPTDTLVPTESDILPTVTRTHTPLPTATNTPEATPAFIDEFNVTLENWDVWANRPLQGASDLFPPYIKAREYLDMAGIGFDKVGATLIQTTTLDSGLVIDFEAEVYNIITTPYLYFDWYPGVETRNYWKIGPFYLMIDSNELIFRYMSGGEQQECKEQIDGTSMRLYRIEFGPDWNVTVYIDDKELGGGTLKELCSRTIDPLDDTIGRITFSGFGFVDSIVITEP